MNHVSSDNQPYINHISSLSEFQLSDRPTYPATKNPLTNGKGKQISLNTQVQSLIIKQHVNGNFLIRSFFSNFGAIKLTRVVVVHHRVIILNRGSMLETARSLANAPSIMTLWVHTRMITNACYIHPLGIQDT